MLPGDDIPDDSSDSALPFSSVPVPEVPPGPESIPVADLPEDQPSLVRIDGVDYYGLARPVDDTDARVYVCDHAEWNAAVKRDSTRIYCYARNPGEDFFHLILMGEVFLIRGDEKFCLRCAMRHGILTRNRLFWQRPAKQAPATEDLPCEERR